MVFYSKETATLTCKCLPRCGCSSGHMRVGLSDASTALGLWLGPGKRVPGKVVSTDMYVETKSMTYLANARASAFLALTFWLPMKDSTVTAMARSMSWAEQYSDRRILQKDSAIRMMASR